MNVVILHGLGKKPTDEWYTNISKKIKKNGYGVIVPVLPSSFKPDLDKTFKFLISEYDFNENTVLVGHSSGASLVLGILQKLPKAVKIKKAVLVAGFSNPNLTDLLHTYVPKKDYDKLFPDKWDWVKIKASCGEFIHIYCDSDPYVQPEQPALIRKKVGGRLVLIENAGHFGVSTGGEKYKYFEELLKYL